MPLNVPCPCGNTLTVSDGAAGTEITCGCGKTLTVPSLRARPSPEQAIEALLLAGRLPLETNCLLCGVATTHAVRCVMECEKAVVTSGAAPAWVWLLATLTFGWVGAAVVRSTEGDGREWGKDRVYELPLRVCPLCRAALTTPQATTAALRRVPVYADLLDRYPRAAVSLPVP